MPRIKSEKSEISKELSRLRDYGYLVFNFNQKQRFGKGLIGFCDHVIIGFGKVIFIEVKIGKDKYSDEQIKLKNEIEKTDCDYILLTSLGICKMFVDELLPIRYSR